MTQPNSNKGKLIFIKNDIFSLMKIAKDLDKGKGKEVIGSRVSQTGGNPDVNPPLNSSNEEEKLPLTSSSNAFGGIKTSKEIYNEVYYGNYRIEQKQWKPSEQSVFKKDILKVIDGLIDRIQDRIIEFKPKKYNFAILQIEGLTAQVIILKELKHEIEGMM